MNFAHNPPSTTFAIPRLPCWQPRDHLEKSIPRSRRHIGWLKERGVQTKVHRCVGLAYYHDSPTSSYCR